MNFCVAMFLILKMEEKSNISCILRFIISRKVKTQLKRKKKRFVQCMEKVLWLIERGKSGLQSSELEISRWTMLHCRADQLKFIVIKSRH